LLREPLCFCTHLTVIPPEDEADQHGDGDRKADPQRTGCSNEATSSVPTTVPAC